MVLPLKVRPVLGADGALMFDTPGHQLPNFPAKQAAVPNAERVEAQLRKAMSHCR